MPQPDLPYNGMSVPVLEDLMLDASHEQEQLIVQELVERGAPTKVCLKCREPIGHGLWCAAHMHMTIQSVSKC